MNKQACRFPFCTALLLLTFGWSSAATLHVGNGQAYPSLSAAAAVVQPGDTILMHGGIYPGGMQITNLKGLPGQWITIRNLPDETVFFEGGANAIHLVEPAYLHVKGLVFRHQTGNGLNTDDGGSYDTPAHHVIFENCVFEDMSASGNNDLLKLSGLDHFEIRNCTFQNGAAGGSGIDMVGCHNGVIQGNYFGAMGSNAIQCKGGSENIRIEGNSFFNAGSRALNIGGSTGLQFFRPDTAHFEAAHIQVFSNIFIGSEAPIAYVGAVNVDVINNTFFQPQKWVVRILQETVDPSRFIECGDNSFRNNIIYLGNIPTETNVGPNTRPETFVYSNNLWYNFENPSWNGPEIPVFETNQILNADPLFADTSTFNFSIPPNSPASGTGAALNDPKFDFLHHHFANPPSIGAIEAVPTSGIEQNIPEDIQSISIFPNPTTDFLWAQYELMASGKPLLELYDLTGRPVALLSNTLQAHGPQRLMLPLPEVAEGIYFLRISLAGKMMGSGPVIVKH